MGTLVSHPPLTYHNSFVLSIPNSQLCLPATCHPDGEHLRTPVIPYNFSLAQTIRKGEHTSSPSRCRLDLSSKEPASHANRNLFTRVIELLVKNRALGKMIGAPLYHPSPFPSPTISPLPPPTFESCECEWLRLSVGFYFIFPLLKRANARDRKAKFGWVMGEERILS
ncbi:hypothetical protein L873DRAFT_1473760 [Choiromyces venosus 120613-1]|uniref:Uncharacterized protein n=1 Tax=Choiromyces venosus 120613-1 TaxID=1336337 RepID=A0A3N4J7I1_9PEZI|nr:hypothetical protein L873DRAFT_1473760 [Choiromyces venosus 120613-1]